MREVTKKCRLCESTGPHKIIAVREMMFGTRELFEYFSCAACDTLQILNPLDGQDLMRHYPADYYSYNSPPSRTVRWLITQHDRYRLHSGGWPIGAFIAAFTTSGGDAVETLSQLELERTFRILDVGCGDGALLDRLAMVGYPNLFGADPLVAADGKTRRGVPLMKCYLDDVPGKFNLIMFNHSLEHVPDMVATLTAVNQKLVADGTCLVRLPTVSSEAWTIYGADWCQIDAPRHIVIPSRQGMALAADKAGLRVDNVIDDSNSFQFVGSEAYRRDVALRDAKISQMFGAKQRREWEKRAKELNRRGRGDQAGFILRTKSG